MSAMYCTYTHPAYTVVEHRWKYGTRRAGAGRRAAGGRWRDAGAVGGLQDAGVAGGALGVAHFGCCSGRVGIASVFRTG